MIKQVFLLSLGLHCIQGCMSNEVKPIVDDPFYAPIYPDVPALSLSPTGSIFSQSRSGGLYTDIKAHKVGDIITIKLAEKTSAKKSAANDLDKSNSLGTIPGLIFNQDYPRLNVKYEDQLGTKRASKSDQSNSLKGDISVNVMQVLNNGNLVIRGEKWITINNGEEFIRITGIIRPQDIDKDNSITSLRVANARIQYSGTGAFANNQKPGWLSQFFFSNWWPF